MDQYIGKILGNRYEILERIGSGGMAVVYKAKCHWLNRFVAIKILKDDLAQDEEFRRRFHEESQAVAMLSHPNIMSIYDVSRAEGSSESDYIVMELIDGITLKQYMQKRGGKLSWREALHFITQIMKGLAHAHGRGIIHRDIKPHNIMVLRDGSVKVADFGIARLMTSNHSTMTQEALGSVHYISPEQARGSRIDARSDIYSAGVVLYEMLTGRLPYEGDSPVAVAIQHINSIPLSPRELEPEIPEALEEITMRAMASELGKRYVSADAMLADLEEFRKNPNISFDYTSADLLLGQGDEPTQALGANTPESVTTKRSAAHKVPSEKPVPQPLAEEDEEDDEEGGGKQIFIAAAIVLLCIVGVGVFLWNGVLREMMGTGETYTIPDVRGYTLEDAMELPEIKENGFTIIEGRQIVDADVPVGQIISQTPEAESIAKSNVKEITVNISIPPSDLLMPDLYDQDQRIAMTQLRAMGLTATLEQGYSEEVIKGNVMSQTPNADEPLTSETEIIIVISQGPEPKPVTMIPVTNMSLESAIEIITKDLGLQVGQIDREANDSYAEGMVFYQSVPAGEPVLSGTTIDLKVSTGPDIVAPPEVSQGPIDTSAPIVTQTPTTPAPTESQSVFSRKTGTVTLPTDRETVTIQVTVDGVPQYAEPETVETKMRIARFTVEGKGVQEIVVYIDSVEAKRYTEDFNS